LFIVPRTLSGRLHPWVMTMEEYMTVDHPVKPGSVGAVPAFVCSPFLDSPEEDCRSPVVGADLGYYSSNGILCPVQSAFRRWRRRDLSGAVVHKMIIPFRSALVVVKRSLKIHPSSGGYKGSKYLWCKREHYETRRTAIFCYLQEH